MLKQDITEILEQTETTKQKQILRLRLKQPRYLCKIARKEFIRMHVAARPQSNNEVSVFTKDVCKGAQRLEKEHPNLRFTNFAVDGVSLETNDAVTSNVKFLDRTSNF